jgi:UDP-2,4-diacetamido-2,4,6-trideoxy-beta-L-altropyranose hydrolase
MPSTLLIRADASVQIGTGHIMRMIALGQEWQARGGEVAFACAEITPALQERLAQEGFALKEITAQPGSAEDLAATCALICQSEEKNPVVALDGYQFDADFQLGLKKAGCRLLVMDDYGHADFYHADWVLNQNISAREELYAKRSPDTKLLLGPKFAMLRKEFLAYKGWQREIAPVAKKILVTLGGSDPNNVTLKVIQALIDFDLHVKVVVGGSNPHLPDLQQVLENKKTPPAKMELVINPADMPGLMAWADLAVAAGGSTFWELAFFGIPSILFTLAENQKDSIQKIRKAEVAIIIEDGENCSECFSKQFLANYNQRKKLKRISDSCLELIDGNGCERAITAIIN